VEGDGFKGKGSLGGKTEKLVRDQREVKIGRLEMWKGILSFG